MIKGLKRAISGLDIRHLIHGKFKEFQDEAI